MITSDYLSVETLYDIIMDPHVRKAMQFASNHNESFTANNKVMYVSHEALLLDYEECLTRKDSKSNNWYNVSAHMLWIGDRTRNVDSAHVEYLRGVHNPIGIKIGPQTKLEDLMSILYLLNPTNEKGKIILIFRFGLKYIESHLPKFLKHIKKSNVNVLYMVDPMHGNTYVDKNTNLKTRCTDDIEKEVYIFIKECYYYQVHFGGIHLELSGDEKIKECLYDTEFDFLHKKNYKSLCDPRLNCTQSMKLVKLICDF